MPKAKRQNRCSVIILCMSIELDWQIIENVPQEPETPPPPQEGRPRRWPLISRKALAAIALILVVAIAGFAVYYDRVYHAQLDQVIPSVLQVARLEAQAIAKGDRDLYLAVQDPDDSAWQEMQSKRFGKLEKEGLSEWGWKATGVEPAPGSVTLEPGGARLDVTYRFSVTQPLPHGPTSVTVVLPQYYKHAPSGWVRAMPSVEYWGPWRHRSGQYFVMRYLQRDASVLEPLVPYMDKLLSRMCDSLPCPPQPIYVVFENSPEAMENWADFTYGFDDGSFQLKFPSPQLFGVPADASSRDEFYRAIGTRVVEALVTEASREHLNLPYLFSQQLLRWELNKANLAGPFITPGITRALASSLQAGVWQPLSALWLRSRSRGSEPTDDEVILPSLALAFLEQHMGAGAIERLIPAMQYNVTMGQAISAVLKVNPHSLEPWWLEYLRKQAGLPAPQLAPPEGELALTCLAGATGSSSILRIGANGSNVQVVEGQVQNVPQPTWSPDGKSLAYLRNGRLLVMDADTQQYQTVAMDSAINTFGWRPDGSLWIGALQADALKSYEVNLETGEDKAIAGANHAWSLDGKRMAYLDYTQVVGNLPAGRFNPGIWLADADGSNAQQVASGLAPAWSPDGKRLAFLTEFRANVVPMSPAGEIRTVDVATGAVSTLTSSRDLSSLMDNPTNVRWLGNLTWSPDGSLLAVSVNQSSGATLFALDASTGEVRAQWRGMSANWMSIAWSADSRYIGFWIAPTLSGDVSAVGALDAATNRAVTLPGRDFDWSPDGKWLAVTQETDSVFLVVPDLSAMRWLDTPNCSTVAWRPVGR